MACTSCSNRPTRVLGRNRCLDQSMQSLLLLQVIVRSHLIGCLIRLGGCDRVWALVPASKPGQLRQSKLPPRKQRSQLSNADLQLTRNTPRPDSDPGSSYKQSRRPSSSPEAPRQPRGSPEYGLSDTRNHSSRRHSRNASSPEHRYPSKRTRASHSSDAKGQQVSVTTSAAGTGNALTMLTAIQTGITDHPDTIMPTHMMTADCQGTADRQVLRTTVTGGGMNPPHDM